MPSLKPHGQMSEAFITALFLSVSGGLQDVYTYLYRGKVFANAQTGNIVLMAVKLFAGEWGEALRYLMPLCAFALGIFVAEFIRLKLKRMQWLHWRQLVVLFEILMLLPLHRGTRSIFHRLPPSQLSLLRLPYNMYRSPDRIPITAPHRCYRASVSAQMLFQPLWFPVRQLLPLRWL